MVGVTHLGILDNWDRHRDDGRLQLLRLAQPTEHETDDRCDARMMYARARVRRRR